MGADLSLMIFPYPSEMNSKRLEELYACIDNLSYEDLDDPLIEEEEFDEGYKELAKEILNGFSEFEERRDCTTFTPYKSYKIILTGGMSWGDAPTGSYEDLEILSHLPPIYNLLEKYAVEDMQKGV